MVSFLEKVRGFIRDRETALPHIKTEDQTKLALVFPFIRLLGYDTTNPHEVFPEFTADMGTKKGEKVDVAIIRDGAPLLLIECKGRGEDLNAHNTQLYRYFSVTSVRFAILTDGVRYRFYSDIEEPNKLDVRPFLEIDLFSAHDFELEQLQRFEKHSFDVDSLTHAAERLKYAGQIKEAFARELRNPSDEFVKYLARNIYSGRFTSRTLSQFREITTAALKEHMRDYVNSHLQQAMQRIGADADDEATAEPPVEVENDVDDDGDGEMGQEEREAFLIIKAITRKSVDVRRLSLMKGRSYCAVLLDNQKRRRLCRLRFGRRKKRIEIPLAEPKVARIESLDDIYSLEEDLRTMAQELAAE